MIKDEKKKKKKEKAVLDDDFLGDLLADPLGKKK